MDHKNTDAVALLKLSQVQLAAIVRRLPAIPVCLTTLDHRDALEAAANASLQEVEGWLYDLDPRWAETKQWER